MRYALCRVDDNGYIVVVGYAYDVVYGIDRTEYIAHMCDADNTCPLGEELFVSIHIKHSLIVHRYDLQDDAFALCQQLPRDDV